MTSAKTKVKTAIEEYIRLFPQEYEAFTKSHRQKEANKENEFAEFNRSEQIVRHLFDLPEVLHHSIQKLLTDEEYDWLYSRNAYEQKRQGLTWFVRTYPQFKITKDF
jgi:hypothetical protein